MSQPAQNSPSPSQFIAVPSNASHPSYPSLIPHSPNPQSLNAHGLSLFRTIFSLVVTVFNSLVRFYQAHPEHDSLRTLTLSIECLTAIFALEYTLHRAPERITPRQLLRLSKAARALSRLTGQSFDFTPWTSLSASELSDLDRLYPPPTNPHAEHRPRPHELRLPSAGPSSTSLRLYPGATLANVIKKLARILPPDFSPQEFLSPSPSPSCSQSAVALESQSQSQSRSQSTQSIGSIESTPSPESTPHSVSCLLTPVSCMPHATKSGMRPSHAQGVHRSSPLDDTS